MMIIFFVLPIIMDTIIVVIKLNMLVFVKINHLQMDVAPWCCKWIGLGMGRVRYNVSAIILRCKFAMIMDILVFAPVVPGGDHLAVVFPVKSGRPKVNQTNLM